MFKVGTLPIMNRTEFVREGMMAKSPKRSSSKEMAMVPYSPKETAMVPYSPKETAMVPYSPKEMAMVPYSPKEMAMVPSKKSRTKKESPVAKKTVKCTTNKNGIPPCAEGFISKLNKKGEDCCYKTKQIKTKKSVSPLKEVTPKKASPVAKKTVKCTTNRNGTPPCADGYTSKMNKKGEDCCYKTKN
jgi:hypothetical protein